MINYFTTYEEGDHSDGESPFRYAPDFWNHIDCIAPHRLYQWMKKGSKIWRLEDEDHPICQQIDARLPVIYVIGIPQENDQMEFKHILGAFDRIPWLDDICESSNLNEIS